MQITIKNADFSKNALGKITSNLINPLGVIHNVYFDKTGVIRSADDGGYAITDYIEVNGKNISSIGLEQSTVWVAAVVYNSNKEKIRVVEADKNGLLKYVYVEGDYYIRICYGAHCYNQNKIDGEHTAESLGYITPYACYGDTLSPYEPYFGGL